MIYSKLEIQKQLKEWLNAWDEHNLDKVMEVMHDEVIFENWTGTVVSGKEKLRKSWIKWFKNHNGFKFSEEDIFIDEYEQKVLFQWKLEWLSFEKEYQGAKEIRRGVDIIHFLNGKIYRKSSYSKTTIQINNSPVVLIAQK
jgi:hypothetical protein